MDTSIKKRIVLISNEMRIEKEGENSYANYSYFQPDDILKAINPLLDKYNLICQFNLEWKQEMLMYRGTLKVEDCDVADGSITYTFDIPMTEVKGSSKAQGAGATQTYCKRYMLMNVFNIADNRDDPDSKEPVKNETETVQKMSVAEVLENVHKANNKKRLDTWKDKVDKTKLYNPMQKAIILRAIEERLGEITTVEV